MLVVPFRKLFEGESVGAYFTGEGSHGDKSEQQMGRSLMLVSGKLYLWFEDLNIFGILWQTCGRLIVVIVDGGRTRDAILLFTS